MTIASLNVFPTGVGMNRAWAITPAACSSVPHRRGDEPVARVMRERFPECSPQAWG